MSFLFVALGGALGSVFRYAISLIPCRTVFPFLTLITNFVGIVSEKSPNTLLFWKTGVCGGFTTFSTFSLEAFSLFEKKMYFLGGLYVILSVGLCLTGVLCGKKLARLFV